ncbi:Heat shock protein HspQ [Trichinella spiralis]|uniref:Heat shock protein HspQ n=1 Tax=Trichinella spiralis TaxID=6334 RepID=A0ABR3KEQ9_TRISP
MLAPIAAENPLRVIPRFHLVRMDESPYNVSIQYYNVKDAHEQPEWPSTSYLAACILSNRLFCNTNSVFGFVVMIDDFRYFLEWL